MGDDNKYMSSRAGEGKPLEVTEIRTIVMDVLRDSMMQDNTIQIEQLPKMILQAGYAKGKLPLSDSDVQNTLTERRIIDVIGMLLNEGIITWGSCIGAGIFNTKTISVTEYGEKILQGEEGSNPHDPGRYLQRFKARVPNVSKLTMMYLEESLYCCNQGRLLASSVMLGVSSEAAFEELYDALTNYVGGSAQTRLEKLRDDIDTQKKFETTIEVLRQEKSRFPDDIKNTIEKPLKALFDIIRMQRNDSGHPTGKTSDREEIQSLLAVFPRQCEFVYKITEWLKASTSP